MILMLVVEIPLMLPVELKIEIIFGKIEWRNFLLHEPIEFWGNMANFKSIDIEQSMG